MQKHLLFLTLLSSLAISANGEIIKIDFDQSGRQSAEVTEPNYTAWPIKNTASETKTFGDVSITVSATGGGTLTCGWSKQMIQSPYYARLVSDGVTTNEDGEGIEIRISGLSAGTHGFQSYNNSWENGSAFEMVPFDLFLGDQKIYEAIVPTVRVASTADATRLYTEFTVNGPNDMVTLRFMPTPDYTLQDDSKSLLRKIFLDALEIGISDAGRQATRPYPSDHDEHADCDEGGISLSWSPAAGCVSHQLYFGTDSAAVADATSEGAGISVSGPLAPNDTVFRVERLTCHNTYWWRVDETDAAGTVTRGTLWHFRPRRLAFRTAEGYGRHAIGGRGGKVVYVTNLNDDGPGSFREALTNDIGPRTILFNVSGIIELKSRLTSVGKYITVAGQTAPGKGVCFRKAPLGIGSDAVWRFVRMRLGSGQTYDGIGMAGADHSILDHASISWTIDEAFSSRGAKNITLQHSLISEALNVAGHENYAYGTAHGYAGSVGGDVASLHHNLLAHNEGRNWSMAGGLDGAGYYAGRLDIFNMVVYNWGGRTTDGGAHEVNFVGNYYKKGPACRRTTLLSADLEGAGAGTQSYYYHNNILTEQNGTPVYKGNDDTQGRTIRTSGGQIVDWTVFADQPFFASYARIETAADAYKSVLSDVGCTMPRFDDHDQRIVREVKEGTTTYVGSYTGYKGLPDNENDVDGYEDYPEEQRPQDFDSDLDGLPDWWENLYGTDPHSPAGDFTDSNSDPDGDGYTLLEDYLEWMARPHYYIYNDTPAVADLSTLTGNYKTPVSYAIEPDSRLLIAIDGNIATIRNADGNAHGVIFLTVSGTDAEGSASRSYIAVAVTGTDTSSLPAISDDILFGTRHDEPIFDLTGQKVLRPAAGGMYIQSGRKFIAR